MQATDNPEHAPPVMREQQHRAADIHSSSKDQQQQQHAHQPAEKPSKQPAQAPLPSQQSSLPTAADLAAAEAALRGATMAVDGGRSADTSATVIEQVFQGLPPDAKAAAQRTLDVAAAAADAVPSPQTQLVDTTRIIASVTTARQLVEQQCPAVAALLAIQPQHMSSVLRNVQVKLDDPPQWTHDNCGRDAAPCTEQLLCRSGLRVAAQDIRLCRVKDCLVAAANAAACDPAKGRDGTGLLGFFQAAHTQMMQERLSCSGWLMVHPQQLCSSSRPSTGVLTWLSCCCGCMTSSSLATLTSCSSLWLHRAGQQLRVDTLCCKQTSTIRQLRTCSHHQQLQHHRAQAFSQGLLMLWASVPGWQLLTASCCLAFSRAWARHQPLM